MVDRRRSHAMRMQVILTGEGDKDFFDVLAILAAWDAQDLIADYDGDRSFTFFDVAAFLDQFSNACTP